MKFSPFAPLLSALALTAAGCSNIDCPLDNVVMMQCNLYERETGTALTLQDALSVAPANSDVIIINRITDTDRLLIPLKEGNDRDTLLLTFSNNAGQNATDTLFVNHLRKPHFESIDCPASVFHTLTSVRFTTHPLSEFPLTLDSVALVRSTVNYDDIENLRLYLRSTSARQ